MGKRKLLFLPLFLTGFLFLMVNMPVFNIFTYVVVSKSMSPQLPLGSLLYIKKADSYSPGDVITFKTKSNNVMTHRIVDSENGMFITRGDANATSDTEIIRKEQVIGKAFFSVPHIGAVVLDVKNLMKS